MALHVRVALARNPYFAGPIHRNLGDALRLEPALKRPQMRAQSRAAALAWLFDRQIFRKGPGVHGSTSCIRSCEAVFKEQKLRSRFKRTLTRSPWATVLVGGMFA